MATEAELREWIGPARQFAVNAARGYLRRFVAHDTAHDHAEEAVQDALPRVLARCEPGSFASAVHFARTVARATIRQAIVNHRRHRENAPLGEHDPADPRAAAADNWTDGCLETFGAAFARLSEDERLMLQRKYVDGWTLQEIADTCGLTANQVWQKINRLRIRLREEIVNRS